MPIIKSTLSKGIIESKYFNSGRSAEGRFFLQKEDQATSFPRWRRKYFKYFEIKKPLLWEISEPMNLDRQRG